MPHPARGAATICAILLSATAIAQDHTGVGAAAALLRGEPDAALDRITEVEPPARRARLQAALRPLPERPAAFLAAARTFGASAEADLAILAGAATTLQALGRGATVPGLADFAALERDDELADSRELAPVVVGLWDALGRRTAAGGDRGLLDEARRLLRIASVSRFDHRVARVRPDARFRIPTPRAEDIVLRAYRAAPGPATFERLDLDREPDRVELLPAGDDPRASIRALPPGSWLVELASAHTPWRAARAVEVSNLDVLALVTPDHVAILLEHDAEPTSATIVIRAEDGAAAATTNLDTAGLVALPAASARTLEARDEHGDVAWLDLRRRWRSSPSRPRWLAHLMTDRPLYRAGDTIHARVVLRETAWSGAGLDAVVEVTPAAGRGLVVHLHLGEDHERRIETRTDERGLATIEAEVPAERAFGPVRIEVAVVDGDERPEVIDERPSRVAAFERPAIAVSAVGADHARVDADEPVEVTARARWASGGPASDVAVRATVRAWRGTWREEERALRTDAGGEVRLPIRVDTLGAGRVQVDFAFASPDGRRETASHTFAVVDARRAPTPRSEDLRLHVAGEPVVGQDCAVEVSGPADARVLLVVGRGDGARVQVVELDRDGRGTATVVPSRAEWPFLDLSAASRDDSASLRTPIRRRPAGEPRIDLPSRVAPGAEVACRVDVGAADAVVTIAVVDERIYTLAPDRTPDPADALRPRPGRPAWTRVRTADPIDPARLLGEMMVQGRIPPLGDRGSIFSGGPATGGPASAGGSVDSSALREDFRATAVFETVLTDPDGVAELRFGMPDDLTTWRATIVGVESDGAAFVARRTLVTANAIAAEPRPPRVLRGGDAIDLPIVVDRSETAVSDQRNVALGITADGLEVEDRQLDVAVAAGRTAEVTARIRAPRAGDAQLHLEARVGSFGDRSRRTLSVAPDAVTRALHADAGGIGAVEITPHPDSSTDGEMTVTVLGSDAAVRRMLERRLERYPYGCVEQTLSGLLPFFAEARGTRDRDGPTPTMDAAFRARFVAGLRRLRTLQERPGGGFAWWPGTEVDLGMTALVIHGLCVMREGGVDPVTVGLDCLVGAAPFADAISRAHRNGRDLDDAGVADVEIVAACLRWAPTDGPARAAAVAVIDRGAALAPGLTARLGLALWAAGDRPRAAVCLSRVGTDRLEVDASSFPGEDPVAVRALAVELAHALGSLGQAPLGELVRAVLAGQGSTYASATAHAALTLVQAGPTTTAPLRVTVRAGTVEREVTLDAEHDFLARVELPFAARVVVAADADVRLRVDLQTGRTERASDHEGWAAPLRVERALLRRDADGELVGLDDGPPRVGDRLAIRVRVTTPVRVRYAVVACALPAGLELPFEPAWLQRFDDRVAFTAAWLSPARPLERTFDVVATHSGRVVWPPTTAGSMYVEGCDGGSAGDWLEIAPARAGDHAVDTAPCFAPTDAAPAPEAPPEAPEPPDPVGDLAAMVDGLWWDAFADGVLTTDAAPPSEAVDAVRAQIGTLAASGPPDTDSLRTLIQLLSDLPSLGSSDASHNLGAGWSPWRTGLRAELGALHRAWTADFVQRVDERGPGDGLRDRLAVAVYALESWPDRDERERMLAHLLQVALTEAPRAATGILDELETPARTRELGDQLLACTAVDEDSLRVQAVLLLSPDDLASMPPAALLELQFGWLDPGIVTILARTAGGQAELFRRCADREFLSDNFDRLQCELPAHAWDAMPLGLYVAIADDCDEDFALDRLATSKISDARLRAAIIGMDEPDLRALCAEALRRRGGVVDGAAEIGPAAAAWDRALRAAADRDVAALELMLDDEDRPEALWFDERPLRDTMHRALAACAGPEVLARRAGELPDEAWDDVFRRLGASGQERLLRAATEVLPELPDSSDQAVLAALWNYGVRCDDLEDAVDTLCLTEAGAAFARQRIATLPDQDLRLRAEGWAEVASDAWSTSPRWRVLHLLRSEGPDRRWTEAERRTLDPVLALRGLR